jgi:hypothetical protein
VTEDAPPWAKPHDWAFAALNACLRILAHDDAALGQRLVEVQDAWLEDGIAICVVYTHIWFPEGVLGLRRTFEQDPESEEEDLDDPDRFGSDVALYDIQEPLGDVAARLRPDDSGVRWWGDLATQLPRKPAV